MNLQEINFSFGGLHCLRDFGCIYIEKGGHGISPPIERNAYEIAGASGTLLMPGEVHGTQTFAGSLYFVRDLPDQASAQIELRRIVQWLTGGRQWLIFDYEPLKYYEAEVSAATKWSYTGWIEGGLDVSFVAQPYAYNVRVSSARAETAGTSAQAVLVLDTGVPAPLTVEIRNSGTATITGAVIEAAGKRVELSGMSINAGQTLSVSMETPIAAEKVTGGGSRTNAMPCATRFDYIALPHGRHVVTVGLTYGSGTRGAVIKASARGRFL